MIKRLAALAAIVVGAIFHKTTGAPVATALVSIGGLFHAVDHFVGNFTPANGGQPQIPASILAMARRAGKALEQAEGKQA